MNIPMKELVIFDLDGTLVDSIADLTTAVNQALEKCGWPLHTSDEYRLMVGDGVLKLFERALPEGERTEENVLRIRDLFIPFYEIHNTDLSRPYEGVVELIGELRRRGVRMAVASNKYHVATVKIIDHFFGADTFELVLGNRDGVPRKPEPTIVNEILERVGVERENTLYVGDTSVDMLTAKNARVDCLAVSWGFRPVVELAQHNPLAIIDKPCQLLDYL